MGVVNLLTDEMEHYDHMYSNIFVGYQEDGVT